MSQIDYNTIHWPGKVLTPEEVKQVHEETLKWKEDPSYIPILPAGAQLTDIPQKHVGVSMGVKTKPPIKFTEIATCSWCKKRAVAKGADGTFSCGSGQGDGKDHHVNMRVRYMPLHGAKGFGFQRIQ
jgi:hypothetical protein